MRFDFSHAFVNDGNHMSSTLNLLFMMMHRVEVQPYRKVLTKRKMIFGSASTDFGGSATGVGNLYSKQSDTVWSMTKIHLVRMISYIQVFNNYWLVIIKLQIFLELVLVYVL